MDSRRVILWAALAFVVYSLWTHWQLEFPASTSAPVVISSKEGGLLPALPDNELTKKPLAVLPQTLSQPTSSKVIHVKTDVLDLSIDLKQGDLIGASLPNYPVSIEEKNKPFPLLQNKEDDRYVANSTLFVVNDQAIHTLDAHFQSAQEEYVLQAGQHQLEVTLTGQVHGLRILKTFIFKTDSYLIDVQYKIINDNAEPWKGYLNTQFLRGSPKEDKSSIFHVGSYTGASYSNPSHRYQKVNFKDMTKANLDVDSTGGWIAMQQHYFLTAWVPEVQSNSHFYTRASEGDYSIGAVSAPIVIAPAQQKVVSTRLYVGPEITSTLKAIAPGLDLTVDYGWLWFLSSLLFSLMKIIYSWVGNWGWSIVLVTVLIKLAFYKLSATSYKSMASMRKLQPKLLALRERHGDDKAKISQATMELYRQEKVNPLGGCLPIVIQIPVFIALYWVLLESVELRQAPFMFWIKDLAMPDPFHILPVIMGATMLIQQRLNPAPPDPMQAKVMMFLPILFTGLFWNFPAGLVLYWIVNNSLSILQQWFITRQYSDDKPANKWITAK